MGLPASTANIFEASLLISRLVISYIRTIRRVYSSLALFIFSDVVLCKLQLEHTELRLRRRAI